MQVYRKYRVPVSLTADQRNDLARLSDGQRAAYNWAVSRIRDGWDPSDVYGLHGKFTPHRRTSGGWMRSVPRAMQNAAIQDACTAAKLAARYGRGRLKYRTKRRSRGTLRCALPPVVAGPHHVRLPRFGTVHAQIPDEIMENEPRSYEFVRTPKGKYQLCVSCRLEVPAPKTTGMTHKGIDRGVTEPTVVATLSPDGRPLAADSYDTAAPFKENRQWNDKMRSKASKKNRRSRRYRDHLRKLGKRMRMVLNRRTYAECVAAKEICTAGRPGSIIFEDLKLSKMTRAGGAHKRGMNREMRFVRHHAIERRIRNRAEVQGVQLLYVRPHHTSQTCSRCGHRDGGSRVTRDMFKCVSCNYVQQADANAAINICRRGMPSAEYDPGIPPEAGTAFVRRQLDARCNQFVARPQGTREPIVCAVPSRTGWRKTSKSAGGRQVTDSH